MAKLFFSKGMLARLVISVSVQDTGKYCISQVTLSCFWELWTSLLESMKSKMMLMEDTEALKLNVLSRLVNHLQMKQ